MIATDAIRLSLECSLWSTALALVFGVLALGPGVDPLGAPVLVERLGLGATLGLLQSEYVGYRYGERDLDGREQAHAPGYQYSVSVQWGGGEGWMARADLNGVDGTTQELLLGVLGDRLLAMGNPLAQFDAFDPVLNTGTFKALKPGHPTVIEASSSNHPYGPEVSQETAPQASITRWKFPAKDGRAQNVSFVSETPEQTRELKISRVFDAPRELVFRCMTEAEHLTHFWGPVGVSTPLANIEVDLRPGGVFNTTMVNDVRDLKTVGDVDLVAVSDPHTLEDVDFAILPGHFTRTGTRKPPSHVVPFSPRKGAYPASGHIIISLPLSVE